MKQKIILYLNDDTINIFATNFDEHIYGDILESVILFFKKQHSLDVIFICDMFDLYDNRLKKIPKKIEKLYLKYECEFCQSYENIINNVVYKDKDAQNQLFSIISIIVDILDDSIYFEYCGYDSNLLNWISYKYAVISHNVLKRQIKLDKLISNS